MRRTTRTTLAAAVTAGLLGAMTGAGTAAADGFKGSDGGGGTFVPFAPTLRRCDFSKTHFNGEAAYARPQGVIRADGSTVSADIQIATAIPNIRYDVRLIQVPRPSSAPCLGGDPGVALVALSTDGSGAGSVTVQDAIEPGATGAWLFITRPDAFSQNPAEFYTSDLIVHI
jgi:hypothetical protein